MTRFQCFTFIFIILKIASYTKIYLESLTASKQPFDQFLYYDNDNEYLCIPATVPNMKQMQCNITVLEFQ